MKTREIERLSRASVPALPGEARVVLAVGIDRYREASWNLASAVRDAAALSDLLRDEFGFQPPHFLSNEQATGPAVRSALDAALDGLGPGDQLLFFFAGHGFGRDGQAWLALHECPGPEGVELSGGGFIGLTEIRYRMDRSPVGQALLILDSCYSGQGMARILDDTLPDEPRQQQVVRELISSGAPRQEVLDGGNEHSIFAQVLLEALDGLLPLEILPDASFEARALLSCLRREVAARLGRRRLPNDYQIPFGGFLGQNLRGASFRFRPSSPRLPTGQLEALVTGGARAKVETIRRAAELLGSDRQRRAFAKRWVEPLVRSPESVELRAAALDFALSLDLLPELLEPWISEALHDEAPVAQRAIRAIVERHADTESSEWLSRLHTEDLLTVWLGHGLPEAWIGPPDLREVTARIDGGAAADDDILGPSERHSGAVASTLVRDAFVGSGPAPIHRLLAHAGLRRIVDTTYSEGLSRALGPERVDWLATEQSARSFTPTPGRCAVLKPLGSVFHTERDLVTTSSQLERFQDDQPHLARLLREFVTGRLVLALGLRSSPGSKRIARMLLAPLSCTVAEASFAPRGPSDSDAFWVDLSVDPAQAIGSIQPSDPSPARRSALGSLSVETRS